MYARVLILLWPVTEDQITENAMFQYLLLTRV